MIEIKGCGHSMNTSDKRFRVDLCFYCDYLEKHPRAVSRRAILRMEQRLERAKRAKSMWTRLKTKQAA